MLFSMRNLLYIILTVLCLSPLAFSSEEELPEAKIVFLGDSLTAGYGVAKEDSFPSLIEKALNSERVLSKKYSYINVVNSGVSGSTSASGLKRLKWVMKSKPTHIVLALGANDGLRGFKTSLTSKNLGEMIEYVQSQKVKLLLVGMQAPPNMGRAYTQPYNKMFPDLAKKYKVKLMPFLLNKVAGEKDLNLPDRIHPNENGYKIIATELLKYLRPML